MCPRPVMPTAVTAMNKASRTRGFTIVEIVVTIVILAIALLGVVAIVRLGTSNSADTMLETRAIALGQAYLDEIMGRRFDEKSAASGLDPCFGLPSDMPAPAKPCTAVASLGTDGGEGSGGGFLRDKWDDVDDYHGWMEGDGETKPIQDAEGDDREGYENFHVEISVRYAGADAAWGPLTDTHAKLITVTVKVRGQDEGWDFSSYKGNY